MLAYLTNFKDYFIKICHVREDYEGKEKIGILMLLIEHKNGLGNELRKTAKCNCQDVGRASA